jgi:cytochrome P450
MDTTGITTGLCFYALAKYPEVLARVEKEIADL